MREESWYKFLAFSAILHVLLIGVLSIPIKKPVKKFDLSSAYSVGLVGDIGGTGGGGAAGPRKATPVAEPKSAPEKPAPAPKAKKQVAAKSKPVPVRAEKEAVPLSRKKVAVKEMPLEKDAVSLSKKKVAAKETKETPTKEELSRLDERIRDMRKRTRYLDVSQGGPGGTGSGGGAGSGGGTGSGGGALPGSGGGGGRSLDAASQQYMLRVWEKIKNAWGLPRTSSYKKNLETVVTIRIRKDGRIVDINVEKRSGNRTYDESILRVLRSVDPLPPIPASLDTDAIEIGFRFLPGDLS